MVRYQLSCRVSTTQHSYCVVDSPPNQSESEKIARCLVKTAFYLPTLEMMRSPITGFANFLFKFCCFPGTCVRLLLFLICRATGDISPDWQKTNFQTGHPTSPVPGLCGELGTSARKKPTQSGHRDEKAYPRRVRLMR